MEEKIFDRDYFVRMGREGGKKSRSRMTKEELQDLAKRMNEAKKLKKQES